MKKLFILGMILPSIAMAQVAPAVSPMSGAQKIEARLLNDAAQLGSDTLALPAKISSSMRDDFDADNSRTVLKDAGVFVGEAAVTYIVGKKMPRNDKKEATLLEKRIAQIQSARTYEQIDNEIKGIAANTANLVPAQDVTGHDMLDQHATVQIKPEVQNQIATLKNERTSAEALIGKLEQDSADSRLVVEDLGKAMESIKDKVSNFEPLSVKDGQTSEVKFIGKLKEGPQKDLDLKTVTKADLEAKIISNTERIANLKARMATIDQTVNADLSNMHKLVPNRESAKQIGLLSFDRDRALTDAKKAELIARMNREYSRIALKGLRGLAIRGIRVVSIAGVSVIVADAGVRGVLVYHLDKDAGWVPALRLSSKVCKETASCLNYLEMTRPAVSFLAANYDSLKQSAIDAMNSANQPQTVNKPSASNQVLELPTLIVRPAPGQTDASATQQPEEKRTKSLI